MPIQRTKGKYGLSIPAVDPNYKPKLAMEEDTLMKWRASLPMANTGPAAKEIFNAIIDIIQTPMDYDKRFKILEFLRPPAQWICQTLRKHYVNQKESLTEQQIKIVQLGKNIQTSIIFGYKLIIEDCLQDPPKNFEQSVLPMAIYRAMHYYNLILLRNYQLYSCAPDTAWNEINILYQIANQKNILNTQILKDESLPHTLRSAYKHILLFAATNPYQWRQKEQELILNALYQWDPFVTLRKAKESDKKQAGIYVVDTSTDEPIKPASLIESNMTSTCLAIDLKELTGHLNEVIEECEQNEMSVKASHERDPEYSISLHTLYRLTKEWGACINRAHTRTKNIGKVQTAFGMSATHYYLSGEQLFNPKRYHEENLEKDIQTDNTTLSPTKSNEIEPVANEKIDSYPKHICHILNASPNGYCVMG